MSSVKARYASLACLAIVDYLSIFARSVPLTIFLVIEGAITLALIIPSLDDIRETTGRYGELAALLIITLSVYLALNSPLLGLGAFAIFLWLLISTISTIAGYRLKYR